MLLNFRVGSTNLVSPRRLPEAEARKCSASPGADCRPANGSVSTGNMRRIFDGTFEMPCAE
eukprot:1195239-Prorocentrum_minimum.AAC.6